MTQEDKLNKISQLAEGIRCNFFADRPTLQEAVDFAYEISKASDNPAAVLTAVFVCMNTISNTLKQILKE